MNASQPSPRPEFPSSSVLITRLGLVSLISGLLIVLVYQLTLPAILENKRLSVQKSIFKVLPGAAASRPFTVGGDGALSLADNGTGGDVIHAAYDAQGKLVGVALEAAAQGYQDVVRVLYGFDTERQCIVGFDVLKSTETPGLGTKIAADTEFLHNFRCLDASVDGDFSALKNPIKTVKHGTKQQPWEIDAIAGATITSKAVGKMLNDSGQKLHPAVMKNLRALRDAAPQSSVNRPTAR
jgi:electron transport complex protein RnfG